jgi:prepilin-type N-terminal cleavage/methylation domain-containing protein
MKSNHERDREIPQCNTVRVGTVNSVVRQCEKRFRVDGGFTLLEIVVALAILGLSLTVTMELISGAFTNISRINQYFLASNHAVNVMNEMLISPDVKGPMQNSGVFEDGYQWTANVMEKVLPPEPVPTPQPYVPMVILLEIQVDVRWQQNARSHVYTLKSMRVVSSMEGELPGLSTPSLQSSPQRQQGTFNPDPANRERLGPRRPSSRRGGNIEPDE